MNEDRLLKIVDFLKKGDLKISWFDTIFDYVLRNFPDIFNNDWGFRNYKGDEYFCLLNPKNNFYNPRYESLQASILCYFGINYYEMEKLLSYSYNWEDSFQWTNIRIGINSTMMDVANRILDYIKYKSSKLNK